MELPHYTFKNHFKFGYYPKLWFSRRESPEQIFTAIYGEIEERVPDWRTANRLAAQKIGEAFKNQKIIICLSGGSDSEVCLRAFLEAQVDCQAAIMKFENDINAEDVSHALRICAELKVPYQIFDLKIIDFWESKEMLEITDPISCVSPIIAAQLWLANQINGIPVIAQGEPHFKKEIHRDYQPGISPYEPSPWYLVESERLCSMYMNFIRLKRPAVPGFFQYLPEQFQAYIENNPIFQRLIDNQIVGKLGTRTSKNDIIRSFYPEVMPRQKLTGIEKIQNRHDQKRIELARRYPWHDQNYRIPLITLKQQLGLEHAF